MLKGIDHLRISLSQKPQLMFVDEQRWKIIAKAQRNRRRKIVMMHVAKLEKRKR